MEQSGGNVSDSGDGLSGKIIGCTMNVHRALGSGFLESMYCNALLHELKKAGIPVVSQKSLEVLYDSVAVGHFVVDMVVAEEIIVAVKAVNN